MGGSGPPPADKRRRRNKDTYADVATTVAPPADDDLYGPELAGDWSDSTRAWHETWRRSPQAAAFLDTDWQRLAMIAPLVNRYFEAPDPKLFTEIRLNETLLGATHVDRLKGRIRVEKPRPAMTAPPVAKPPVEPDNVTSIASRRKRLAG